MSQKKSEMSKFEKRAKKHQSEVAKAFDITEFLVGPEYVQTKDVVLFPSTPREQVRKVTFGAISIGETIKLEGDSDHEKGIDMLYRLLHQGDSTITKEQVQKLDSDVATALLKAITGKERPLPAKPDSGS